MSPLRMLLNGAAVLVGVLAVVSVVAISVLPGNLGMATYVVRSGSMEPAIHTGSIIFAKGVTPQTLQVGDVVVYNSPTIGESVTHRIVEVDGEGGQPTFVTKGDANGAPDSWTVHYQGEAGKVVFSLPIAGYVWNAVNSSRGKLVFLIVPVCVLTVLWLLQIWRPSTASTDGVGEMTPGNTA